MMYCTTRSPVFVCCYASHLSLSIPFLSVRQNVWWLGETRDLRHKETCNLYLISLQLSIGPSIEERARLYKKDSLLLFPA